MNDETAMTLEEIEKLCQTSNREVEFAVNGRKTGWVFELRPDTSDEVQECMRRFNSRARKTLVKRNTTEFDELSEKHADDLRIAHVANWYYRAGVSEGRPAFSRKELREVLNTRPFGLLVSAFIDREVGSLEDFLNKWETS